MTTDAPHDSTELHVEQVQPPPASVRSAVHLFGTGLLGGVLTVFGLVILAEPLTHSHGCGGTTATLRTEAERRQRCLELGITPEELAALEASTATIDSADARGED